MGCKQESEKGSLDDPLTLFFSTASAITTHFLWKDPMLNCLAFLTPSFIKGSYQNLANSWRSEIKKNKFTLNPIYDSIIDRPELMVLMGFYFTDFNHISENYSIIKDASQNIINNPSSISDIFESTFNYSNLKDIIELFLSTTCSLMVNEVIKGFTHSKIRPAIKDFLKSYYLRFIKRDKKAALEQEVNNSKKYDLKFLEICPILSYLKEEEIGQSLNLFNEFLESKYDRENLENIFYENNPVTSLASLLIQGYVEISLVKSLICHNHDLNLILSRSILSYYCGHFDLLNACFTDAINEKSKYTTEIATVYAKALAELNNNLNKKKAENSHKYSKIYSHLKWKTLDIYNTNIRNIFDNETPLKDAIDHESNSNIYRLDSEGYKFNLDHFILKSNLDRVVLERESIKAKELEQIIKDYKSEYHSMVHGSEKFEVIESIRISEEIKDQYFYITKYCKGNPLSKSKDIEDYKRAAMFLGLIHKKMKSNLGFVSLENDLIDKIGKSFDEPEMEGILDNIDVVYNSIQGDSVFNKDAHGENWIITDNGTVIAIDMEDKGYVNQFTDLVKITEYSDLFKDNYEKRKAIWDSYFQIYNKNGILDWVIGIKDKIQNFNFAKKNSNSKKELTPEEIELSYLNATILKAFTFYSYSKEKENTTQKGFRRDVQKNIINNGLYAIKRIKDNHSSNYLDKDFKKYDCLYNLLDSLEVHA